MSIRHVKATGFVAHDYLIFWDKEWIGTATKTSTDRSSRQVFYFEPSERGEQIGCKKAAYLTMASLKDNVLDMGA